MSASERESGATSAARAARKAERTRRRDRVFGVEGLRRIQVGQKIVQVTLTASYMTKLMHLAEQIKIPFVQKLLPGEEQASANKPRGPEVLYRQWAAPGDGNWWPDLRHYQRATWQQRYGRERAIAALETVLRVHRSSFLPLKKVTIRKTKAWPKDGSVNGAAPSSPVINA